MQHHRRRGKQRGNESSGNVSRQTLHTQDKDIEDGEKDAKQEHGR